MRWTEMMDSEFGDLSLFLVLTHMGHETLGNLSLSVTYLSAKWDTKNIYRLLTRILNIPQCLAHHVC